MTTKDIEVTFLPLPLDHDNRERCGCGKIASLYAHAQDQEEANVPCCAADDCKEEAEFIACMIAHGLPSI